MAFKENLQYLRAQHNMTQEQLAMLVGVSRQAISKWESDKAYPEMDKLLNICEIFDCSLDTLVMGDVTQYTTQSNTSEDNDEAHDPMNTAHIYAVPNTPAQDITGYDRMLKKFQLGIASGVFFIILGVALAQLFTVPVFTHNEGVNEVLQFVWVMLGVILGLVCIIPISMQYDAFKKAHPFVEDFYTLQDKAQARKEFAIFLISGITLVVCGAVISACADEIYHIDDGWPYTLMLVFIAIGVFCLIYGGINMKRINIDEYNKENEHHENKGYHVTIYDTVNGAICGIIMILATIIGLSMLFFFDGGPRGYFWMSWPIGGLLCAISSIIFQALRSIHQSK